MTRGPRREGDVVVTSIVDGDGGACVREFEAWEEEGHLGEIPCRRARTCYPSAAMGTSVRDPFRAAVEWVQPDVLLDLVSRWDAATVARAERWARSELAALPLPVHPYVAGDLVRRRSRLEILLGAIESRSAGDDARLLEAARREWVHGASHATYLRLLFRLGRRDHAVKLALSLLEESSDEFGEVRAMLDRTLRMPPGTEVRIAELVASPTLDRWLDVVRFWSTAEREFRIRYAIVRMLGEGVDADSIFRLIATEGPIEPVIDLVDRGIVDPAVIVAFASELGVAERAAFFGLAARSAAARGESFRAARYLRDARALGLANTTLDADVAYVRAHADANLFRALVASGFPGAPTIES